MGIVTNQNSPILFAGLVTSGIPNVTGDGTTYTLVYDTESADTGSIFNAATGIMTADVAGIYGLQVSVLCSGLIAANTTFALRLQTSNIGEVIIQNWDSTAYTGGNAGGAGAVSFLMPAAATAKVELKISGNGSANVAVEARSMFSGQLLLDLT